MDNYRKSLERKRKARIERIHKILSQKGYKWIDSSEYKDSSTSFCRIKCSKNHEFSSHNKSVLRNVNCPICFNNLFAGETICRLVLESLLGYSLPKTRQIKGLINPENGRILEVDGFNKENLVGFEYQGLQHYEYNEYFHKNVKCFEKIKEKDVIKANFFKNKKWTLIVIKQLYDLNIEVVIENITNLLNKQFPELPLRFVNPSQVLDILNITTEMKNSDYKHIMQKHYGSDENFYKEKCFTYLKNNGATFVEGLFNSVSNMIKIETKQKNIVSIKLDYLLTIIDSDIKDNKITHQTIKEDKLQEILKIAKKIPSLLYFRKKHPELAAWIRRHKYTNQLRAVFGLEKSESKGIRKYTDEYLINEAKQFKTRGEMYHQGRNAYELIILRKLQPLAFAHMVKSYRKKTTQK